MIILPNKLEALLAALDVNVGAFSDNDEMPGTAYPVEHVGQRVSFTPTYHIVIVVTNHTLHSSYLRAPRSIQKKTLLRPTSRLIPDILMLTLTLP